MHLFKSIVLAGSSVTGSFGAPFANTSASPEQCHKYVLISSRGTGELQGPSVGFIGMIDTTLDAVPGGLEYEVAYPAAPDITQQTTLIGAHDIENYVKDGLKSCPMQTYALLGYSQGATVVLQALHEMSGTPQGDAVKAVVLIGNPYQTKDQPSTVDENGDSSTRANEGILLPLAGTLPVSPILEDDSKVLNICYSGDPVCNGISAVFTSPLHLIYGFSPKVQNLGSEFLISRLKED